MPLNRDAGDSAMNASIYTEVKRQSRERPSQHTRQQTPRAEIPQRDQPEITESYDHADQGLKVRRDGSPSLYHEISRDERVKRAQPLKLSINNWRAARETSNTQRAQEVPPDPIYHALADHQNIQVEQKQTPFPASMFDDTQSLPLDDTEDYEEQTQVFRPQAMDQIEPQTSLPEGQKRAYAHVQNDHKDEDVDVYEHIPEDWPEQVADERSRLYNARLHNREDDANDMDHNVCYSDEEMDDCESPSRARNGLPHTGAAEANKTQRTVAFADSPDFHSAQLHREDSPPLDMPKDFKDTVRGRNLPLLSKTKVSHPITATSPDASREQGQALAQPRLPKFFDNQARSMQMTPKVSSRESDIVEPSEDEESIIVTDQEIHGSADPDADIPQKPKKRQWEDELDYQPDILKQKTFADLLSETFTCDPQVPGQESIRDAHGNVMTVPQVLSKLGEMKTDDQKTLFRAQTDDDWSATGQWFIDKFRDDLQKLTTVRLERRKISVRFENEIRRRHAQIQKTGQDVEYEFKDLQKGSEGLMKGRTSSRVSKPLR